MATKTKDKKPKTPKTKRPKQPDLPDLKGPGVAPEQFKDIESIADDYVEVRDERMTLTNREVTLRTALGQVMHEHSLTVYRYDGFEVTVKPPEGEKVSVKKIKEEPDDDGEGVHVGRADEGLGDGE
jgi:hypothetical protein